MKIRITLLILMSTFVHFAKAGNLGLDPLKNADGEIDKTYLFQTPQGTIDVNGGKKGKIELGLRFLSDVGIDMTYNLNKNRLHFTGTFTHNFQLAMYYDWMFNVSSAPGLSVYGGAGMAVRFEDWSPFGIGGNLGVQYAFSGAPIAVGFDWRPTWWLANHSYFDSGDFAFMVRFQF
ncbi:hypothetical protein [Flammeovirga sp. SJP92]|uniref:hypothetical protein n=1 Tax=Flammeovirga sp. SJP92 TaxID=1775430 RepID=UPI0012F7A598|nr:hypothetical protein [Flammeovirga sp. SJP92]